ncbi:LLM class F420-dependent oxidoreductase [Rhodococcus oxybenzonivorans]|uniref:LLM class F420-dependent oxidoreductase n=1 Tax=Rhodococcus oxybenzonivorans TaxID=1990687 RepID=UPI0029536FE2|nr:LLM class F420-dependent oxidoreductase [Rhodococcus oxybenzonivorans]MDV7352716.1 LLM class F420-dependent oxidoreductase [Rhodococcus oxybenzonivorans]
MAVKFNLMFPMRAVKHYAHWIGDGSLGKLARIVEDAGFDGFSMSEHPYPDKDWLANGGHHAFDPFVSLSMAAEATQRIRLITYVMVAGYRSPYLGAKSASSLDVLSGGRLTLGMAAGYLKAEFEALGADFVRRGKLLDEAIAAMRATWAGVDHDGPEFGASNHLSYPLPTRTEGPPIWIGGNSKAAQRRVVELADGWMPMAQDARTAEITRTPALENLDTLRSMITGQNKRRAELGKQDIDVSFVPFEKELLRTADTAAFCAALSPRLDEYADAGVTWITIEPASRSFDAFIRDVELLSTTLIHR